MADGQGEHKGRARLGGYVPNTIYKDRLAKRKGGGLGSAVAQGAKVAGGVRSIRASRKKRKAAKQAKIDAKNAFNVKTFSDRVKETPYG